ncbi:MAG: helix-turn-helix transcriptional regulator [Halobacteriota archaeon]
MAPLTEISEDIYERLRLAACSEQRRALILSLNEGEKSLSDLRGEMQLDSATIIHALRALERDNFVREDAKRNYALTVIGKTVAHKVIDFFETTGALVKYEMFWLEHDLSGIPDYLLGMMLLLRDSMVLASSETDIFEAYRRGIAFFEGANAFRIVSAAEMPDAARFLNKFAAHRVPLQLVLIGDLLDALIERADIARVAKTLGRRCQVYILRHDLKLSLALSDSVMALMLDDVHGTMDVTNTLVARSKDGVTWGTALFNHYVEASEMVTL